MTTNFAQTLRSLDTARHGSWSLLAALTLLAAWTSWFAWARVTVYASSQRARIEVVHTVRRVASPETGRIAQFACRLGQTVVAGELLAVIDDSVETAALEREERALAGVSRRIDAVRLEIRAEHATRVARTRVAVLATQHAGVSLEQAALAASHSAELAKAASELHEHHALGRLDTLRADVESHNEQLRRDQAQIDVGRQRAEHEYGDRTQLAKIAELERMLIELEAERKVRQTAVTAMRAQLERRKLRAPTSGRVGSVGAFQVGDVVQPGDVLATIVPSEDLHVVASFEPDDASGRIQPGHRARVRLHGFSWLEYGALEATVSRVANEPSAGALRVELELDAMQLGHVPIQHGLPATVDVAIDSSSPWRLVKRSIGVRLGRASQAQAAGAP